MRYMAAYAMLQMKGQWKRYFHILTYMIAAHQEQSSGQQNKAMEDIQINFRSLYNVTWSIIAAIGIGRPRADLHVYVHYSALI